MSNPAILVELSVEDGIVDVKINTPVDFFEDQDRAVGFMLKLREVVLKKAAEEKAREVEDAGSTDTTKPTIH